MWKKASQMLRLRTKAGAIVLLALLVGAVLAPVRPSEVHAGDLLVPEEWRRAHPGPYTITVAVLMDEEWADEFGSDARTQAKDIVAAASRHLRPAEINLRPVFYGDWVSPNATSNIIHLLDSLEAGHPAAHADLVIGLTAGYRGREGGVSRPRGSDVIVKHHPYRLDRDAYILAHEIGHVLGLHSCDDDCDCFMMHGVYDPDEHWCKHHLELLRANGGYFQYLTNPSI